MVGNLISNFYPQFTLRRTEAIFGDTKSEPTSVTNTLLLLSRHFVWIQKFTSKKLDEVIFINFLKSQVGLLANVMKSKDKDCKFLKDWENILNHLGIEIRKNEDNLVTLFH